MRARVPLDVDLEDKLLYGLTPTRLAYLVVAMLGGFALWSSSWAPPPVRAVPCLLVVAVGVALAWGRWRGRPADGWITDIALFIVTSNRVAWNGPWLVRFKGRSSKAAATATDESSPPMREAIATAA